MTIDVFRSITLWIQIMAGSWFFDENFNGVSEEFFDKVIDSLDFQLEDADINAGGEDWNAKFQCLETPSMDVLAGFQCQSDTSKLHRKFHNPVSCLYCYELWMVVLYGEVDNVMNMGSLFDPVCYNKLFCFFLTKS